LSRFIRLAVSPEPKRRSHATHPQGRQHSRSSKGLTRATGRDEWTQHHLGELGDRNEATRGTTFRAKVREALESGGTAQRGVAGVLVTGRLARGKALVGLRSERRISHAPLASSHLQADSTRNESSRESAHLDTGGPTTDQTLARDGRSVEAGESQQRRDRPGNGRSGHAP